MQRQKTFGRPRDTMTSYKTTDATGVDSYSSNWVPIEEVKLSKQSIISVCI